jgi:cell surface protein SprA
MEYMGLGFVNNATTGNPVPSSMFDISTVSINESFSPLGGLSVTFNNGLTTSLRYNRARILTLSMTSQQITEAITKDFTVGLGYKINDIKIFGKPKHRKMTNSRSRAKGRNADNENDKQQNDRSGDTSTGMANPLNLNFNLSLRDQSAVNRNINTLLSQATSGNKALKISFTADYTLSKLLTLKAYYEHQTTTPLLTSSAYPTTTRDFGIAVRFSLAR